MTAFQFDRRSTDVGRTSTPRRRLSRITIGVCAAGVVAGAAIGWRVVSVSGPRINTTALMSAPPGDVHASDVPKEPSAFGSLTGLGSQQRSTAIVVPSPAPSNQQVAAPPIPIPPPAASLPLSAAAVAQSSPPAAVPRATVEPTKPPSLPAPDVNALSSARSKDADQPKQVQANVKQDAVAAAGFDLAATMIRRGDIAGARVVLGRLYRQGNMTAAFQLGQTYDPAVLKTWNVQGMRGDESQARNLYEEAAASGNIDAQERLKLLASSDGATPAR